MCENFVNCVVSYGLSQCVQYPTRMENFLDLIFHSQFLEMGVTDVLTPFSTSDHCKIFSEFYVDYCTEDALSSLRKNFLKGDYASFNAHMQSYDWNNFLNSNDSVDNMWTKFLHELNACVELYIPSEQINHDDKNSKKYIYPKYITKLLIKKKMIWRDRFKTNGRFVYANFAKKCKKAIENYHSWREMAIIKRKQKNFFTFMNSKLKSRAKFPPMKGHDRSEDDTSEGKADGFLKEFLTYFTVDDGKRPFFQLNKPLNDFIQYLVVTPNSILNQLKKLNKNSAAGPDGLPGYLWYSLRQSIEVPLAIIYNKSLNEGKLPVMWKKSIITPIFKKGDPTLYGNYRPVALTCIACKIMESILRDEIITFLIKHDLINKSQHGFLAKHSTGTQLLECLNDWTRAAELGMLTDVCYIDFSKAFDSVSIPKLLYKMSCYGLKGQIYNWLTNFLSNRTFRVRVDDYYSTEKEQTSGVPEGSVLGPICFVLFINDLADCVHYSICKLYADDVKLYHMFINEDQCNLFQLDIDAISSWAKTWQLTISLTKTLMLHIGYKNAKHIYNINGNVIVSVTSVKDLGVYVSNDLSRKFHCCETAKRASRVANIIMHSFSCKDVNVYLKAFDSYVAPILDYCSYLWSPIFACDVNLIENVQRSFTRRVFYRCGLDRLSYNERLSVLNRNCIAYRHLLHSLCMFFNIYKKFVCCNVLQDFSAISSVHSFNLRRVLPHSLFIPFCRTSIRKKYFTFRLLPIGTYCLLQF